MLCRAARFKLFFRFLDDFLELSFDFVVHGLAVANLLEKRSMAGIEKPVERLLEWTNISNFQVVQQSLCSGLDDRYLFFDGKRYILILL